MEFILYVIKLLLWAVLFSVIIIGFNLGPVKLVSLTNIPSSDDTVSIYANAQSGMLSSIVKDHLFRVYVPNSFDKTVSVINPVTYKVIGTFTTGKNPQHITPSYDLRTLYVLNDLANSVTPINPKTGKHSANIPVFDPYNMYFTPDGRFAIVVVEAGKRLDFREAKTMKLFETVPVQCNGANHMDFTADGRFALLSCEFSGQLVKLDINNRKVLKYLTLDSCSKKHSMPQDVRLSPDGHTFYVADMMQNGLFLIDADKFRQLGFIATGIGAHSIYPSRNGRLFYVGNRGCNSVNKCSPRGPGSISIVDPQIQKVIATWSIPGGGSPDMGNVTADGRELWLSGRYDGEVYVFDTQTGQLTHRISVGGGPHGLTVWPQPGRYSLGHTGNMR
jgi:YVTN family beta-propeller protein